MKRAKAEVGADGMHEHLPDASVTWSDDSTLTMSPEVPIASGEARIARKRHSERSVVVVRGRTLGAECVYSRMVVGWQASKSCS